MKPTTKSPLAVSEDVLQKARDEIREDESRKQQSLQQFKDWLAKHPFIKRCTTEDRHLLCFLRTKKYQMDAVYDAFEKALIFIKTHPEWYDVSDQSVQRCMELYESGFLRVTKARDSKGRRTIFINHNFDLEKFTGEDIFRLHCLVAPMLSHEEESQLCGVNYVADFTGDVSMKHLTVCPLKALFDFVSQIRFTPLRYKSICIIGVPGFASQFLNMIKLGLSETMLKRLHVLNSVKDLWTFVERDTMTEKYGGKYGDFETMEDFKRLIMERLESWREFLDYDIDLAKAKELKNVHETVGSFRKLEID